MWKIVEKQRKFLRDEQGYVTKDWGGKTSVALVYPNIYYVGMSNLAVHTIYKLFNDHSNIVCERAFLPDPKDLAEQCRTKTPILSIESQRPLSEFDCIAFSISFQNDFLNILPILSLCSIPHRKSERTKDHPLLIAGGCAVTINHRPLEEIFDAFVIGEGEETIDVIASSASQSCEIPPHPPLEKGGRGDLGIATAPFDFAQGRQRGRRCITKNLDDWPTQTVIYTPHTEFGDMHLIETSRGCPRRCKFCVAPCIYSPLRHRSLDAIMKMVHQGLPHRKRMGLIGSDLLSHPAFLDVANEIHNLGAMFSPSSLCVDEIDNRVAALLAKSGHKSVSLGVEAASDRLRSSVGKKFSSEHVLEVVEALAKHGICSIRLYFMIGLPGETFEDVSAIADLSRRILLTIRKAAPRGARSTSVKLTIAPFVPKPTTPFENEKFAGEEYLKDAIKLLKKLLGGSKGIWVHADPIIRSVYDAMLSQGDHTLISFLEQHYSSSSANFG